MSERIRNVMAPEPANYEAYLYQWEIPQDDGSIKKYLGYHKGFPQDNYNHSSGDPDLNYAIATQDNIIFHVLDYGTSEEMAQAERVLLEKVDARNNDAWYNKTNGGGRHSKLDPLEDLMIFHEKSKDTAKFYNCDQLKDLEPYQTRLTLINTDHVNDLLDVMEKDTNPDKFPPISVLMNEDGQPSKIISGNHRTKACLKSKNTIGLNVIEIPYEKWSKLSNIDLTTFGNRLNPNPSEPVLASDVATMANYAADLAYEKYDLNIDHSEIKNELVRQGYGGSAINKILSKARAILSNNEDIINAGDNWISFDNDFINLNDQVNDAWNNINQQLLKEYDVVYKISGSNPDLGKVLKQISKFDPSFNSCRCIVVYYFKNPAEKKRKMQFVEELMDYCANLCNHIPITIDFEELPNTLSEIDKHIGS